MRAREDRFVVMVAIDELTEETCNKLGLKYEIVKLAADGIVTITVFDKNELPVPYVSFATGKLQNYDKICKKLVKDTTKKFIDKQSKKK